MDIKDPMPAAVSRATHAGGLDQQHGRDRRRAEQERNRRKGRGRGQQNADLGWPVPAHEPEGQEAEATAERDQGGLRTHDGPEADRGKSCEDHARQLDRLGWRCVEPVRGNVSPGARQTRDREGREHPCDAQDRQRPPFRRPAEPELLRQVGVDPLLDLVDQLQEAPGDRRRHHAHGPRKHQQHRELPAAED
jgi:hypothetical protein